jgi:hypothetical protein
MSYTINDLTSNSVTLTSGTTDNTQWNVAGAGATSWITTTTLPYTFAPNTPYTPYGTLSNDRMLKVEGDAEISGSLKVGGKDLGDTLAAIEARLAILHCNPSLEDKWEKLKDLGNQYRALEKDILEKEKIWDIIKK